MEVLLEMAVLLVVEVELEEMMVVVVVVLTQSPNLDRILVAFLEA